MLTFSRGGARLGQAAHGPARSGVAGQGKDLFVSFSARLGLAPRGTVRPGSAWQGPARPGSARQGFVWFFPRVVRLARAGQGNPGQGKARQPMNGEQDAAHHHSH